MAPRSQLVLPSAWRGARGNLIPASVWVFNAVMSPESHPTPSHPSHHPWSTLKSLEEETTLGDLPSPAQAKMNEAISLHDSQELDLN